jgi:hypothetical protein
MKELQWFPPIPETHTPSAPRLIWLTLAAAGVGALAFARGHHPWAFAVWAAALGVAFVSVLPVSRSGMRRALNWLAKAAGQVSTLAVLWPFYVLVFGTVHLFLRLARVDLLGLRLRPERSSYWEAAAPEEKRARYYQRLYSLEPARRESRLLAWAIGMLALLLALAASGELLLRSMGFGHPIVYRVDPLVGYYPAPHQDVHRYGGEIHINGFGMRSPDITLAKHTGTFRVLMLGDSTLYGGSYLDQSQLYSTELAGLLRQNLSALPNSPRQVQVLSMGANAWGPQHELAYTKEFGLFDADLVMVMGPPNDAYRPLYGLSRLPFFAEGQRPPLAWQEFWRQVWWQVNLRMSGAAGDISAANQSAEVLGRGVAAWVEIARAAKSHGALVDFEFLPAESEARYNRPGASTRRVLEALGTQIVPVGFPLQFFRQNLSIPKLYHDDVHLDVAGHRLYASYLRDRVLWMYRPQ